VRGCGFGGSTKMMMRWREVGMVGKTTRDAHHPWKAEKADQRRSKKKQLLVDAGNASSVTIDRRTNWIYNN
jgi:hypothetical protein